MSLKEEILSFAIQHWSRHFGGVSALSVSEQVGCSHQEALDAIGELESEGLGRLREDVTLYPVSIRLDGPADFVEHGPVVTSIFFPDSSVLTDHFYSSSLAREGPPEFLARLHKGASQIDLAYFSVEVLRKYLDPPEVYDVDDSVAGGILTLDADFENQLSEAELDARWFDKVRFGKRRLQNGKTAVSALLHDLAELPQFEQSHWHAHELDEPDFAAEDVDFARFVARNYEGRFIDYDDPLQKALDSISEVNHICGEEQLFRKEGNPYLSYPVLNTYKDFCDRCSELYKVIGPDSLNSRVIKKLLAEQYGLSAPDFKHKESGRPMSAQQLLGLLGARVQPVAQFVEVLKTIKNHRISADHRIVEPQGSDSNYIEDFRSICVDLHASLKSMHEVFSTLNEQPHNNAL